MIISGWGRYPKINSEILTPRTEEELRKLCIEDNKIARGNGRSYGDSAISNNKTIHMKHFRRMLSFDSETGVLVAEAGVLLSDVIEIFLPRGWFPTVTPGTKFVTLGGMIAADVHGKNHHKDGSLRNYVDWIDVIVADGSLKRCSKEQNSELFEWTLGGMGLTGIVVRAAMRLRPINTAWIKQETVHTKNLKETIDVFERCCESTYSVAWIDCLQTGMALGRSIIMLGEHANVHELHKKHQSKPLTVKSAKKRRISFDFPGWFLSRPTVKLFNTYYYWSSKFKKKQSIIDWNSYFYPLDALEDWNKIYGKRGLVQFQCVLPIDQAQQGLTELIREISRTHVGSFLAVLKRFGHQHGKFSFPMKGYTLALDFPVNSKALILLETLDQITVAYGGRFYLAKDARMSLDSFQKTEHRSNEFRTWRKKNGADQKFNSVQAARLKL